MFQTPSNFKDARLIVGIYRIQDLLFLIGSSVVTLVLVLFYLIWMKGSNIFIFAFLLIPAITAGIFTFRFPIYHNFYGWFQALINFNSRDKRYVWCGITCSNDESSTDSNELFNEEDVNDEE